MRSSNTNSTPARRAAALTATLATVIVVGALACSDSISSPTRRAAPHPDAMVALNCTASIARPTVTCEAPQSAHSASANRDIIGGQNTFLKLTSSNVAYDACTGIFEFDATVQNLLNEAIGTPDGTLADTAGVRVFFSQTPTATAGTGTITIANADGAGTFTGANQPYYKYAGALAHNAVSSSKHWQFNVPSSVATFEFKVYVSATAQPLLVINEVLANPGGTILDANGEWLEIYNAGTRAVDMQGYLIADSAVSGPRPPHTIASSLVVQPGAYVVLGNTMNTTNNGGVPVDYAYGSALQLANSLRAIKLSRVFLNSGGTPDTLTIDYVRYSIASISAQNGISRELTNPALDNINMDGSNWGDASVVSVYGPGGRGTPGAQNSVFTP
jgi:hypothetical protein